MVAAPLTASCYSIASRGETVSDADSHYGDLPMHRIMLRDSVRCEACRQALAKSVAPGDVVLDVGAGTGILSLFAAGAGARKVYAVERTGVVDVARQLIGANRVGRRVQIIYGDVQAVDG